MNIFVKIHQTRKATLAATQSKITVAMIHNTVETIWDRRFSSGSSNRLEREKRARPRQIDRTLSTSPVKFAQDHPRLCHPSAKLHGRFRKNRYARGGLFVATKENTFKTFALSTALKNALEQFWPSHSERRIVRAGSDALRIGRRVFAVGIAQVTRRGFELAHFGQTVTTSLAVRFDEVSLIGHHENAAVGTVRSTQAAANAVVLNDDLKVLAAVNRVHRTADHAMRIEAGTARGRDDEIREPLAISQQTRDGNPVRMTSMLFDATSGALVAAGASIQIEDENASAFVKSLVHVVGEQAFPGFFTSEAGE